jgi:cell wall-associated NlpC family hydrolase
MFERFTSSYFLGRLYVEPYGGDHAALQASDHRRTNERLYASGEGVERLDYPLVMKFDGEGGHFPVVADEEVPSGTLAVPESLAGDRVPGRREVLLADVDRAREMLRYAGYVVGGPDDPAPDVDVGR